VNEVLQQQGQKIYVGIHPHKDVASIPKTKKLDIVRLGFNNVDGIPVMVMNNSKKMLLGDMLTNMIWMVF
jgi:hypothetical protein